MQLNLRIDKEFEEELSELVAISGAASKTAAIRAAVHEKLERDRKANVPFDFRSLIGVAGKPADPDYNRDDLFAGMEA